MEAEFVDFPAGWKQMVSISPANYLALQFSCHEAEDQVTTRM